MQAKTINTAPAIIHKFVKSFLISPIFVGSSKGTDSSATFSSVSVTAPPVIGATATTGTFS